MANLYERYNEVYGESVPTYLDGESVNLILLAQIFRIGVTGANEKLVLSSIQLYLEKVGTPAGDLTIEIRSVSGTTIGGIVAAGTIAMADITTAGWYLCNNFTGNTTIEASTSYAIVINHLETQTAANYLTVYGDTTDYNSANYGFYSADAGTSWHAIYPIFNPTNFAFRVYGNPYTTGSTSYDNYSNVIAKAGVGANTTSASIANISNYVQSAQSVLNVMTKKNWTDEYTSLSEDVKYMIDETISNLAAIKVINYDMSGYTSRLEAEGMKLTLWNEAKEYMEKLKDVDIQKFMVNV
jgi:hypothetical protein